MGTIVEITVYVASIDYYALIIKYALKFISEMVQRKSVALQERNLHLQGPKSAKDADFERNSASFMTSTPCSLHG